MTNESKQKSFLEMTLSEAEAYLKEQSSNGMDYLKEAKLARRRQLYRVKSNEKLLQKIKELREKEGK